MKRPAIKQACYAGRFIAGLLHGGFAYLPVMKQLFLLTTLLACYSLHATGNDSTRYYLLPDSVKAISFIADINITSVTGKKTLAGISATDIKLFFQSGKKGKELVFEFPSSAAVAATGMDIQKSKGQLKWKYDWKQNEI